MTRTMHRTHRFAAVVFDLDGTLVDSLPDIHLALDRLLAEHGRPSVERAAVRTMVGNGAVKLVERGFRATGAAPAGAALDAAVARYLELYREHLVVDTVAFPGLADALARLRSEGCRLAVCTNKPEAPTVGILCGLGLERHFTAIVAGDSVGAKKPDPRPLRTAIERLGIDPVHAVLVGDSPTDVATARAAGVPVVAVSFGYSAVPAAELGADAVIDRFDELHEALAAL